MAKTTLLFGIHTVDHFLDQHPERVLTAYIQDRSSNPRLRELMKKIRICGCHLNMVDKNLLDKHTDGGRHQGVILEVRGSVTTNESKLDDIIDEAGADALILVLDNVQDPRNLGACLRVADGAGVTVVIAPKNRAAGLTLSARKVASGAAVPFIQVTNLARTLKQLKEKNIWITGTSDQAKEDLYAANLTGPLAIVLGGEEKGMRRLTAENCDTLTSIPMKGNVSSLNVSVAAGIVLYEAVRQRQIK